MVLFSHHVQIINHLNSVFMAPMRKSSWIIASVVVLWSSCTYDHFNDIGSACAGTSLALVISITNASTCGASDGKVTLAAKGGVKNYSFSINGGSFQPDSVYSNLKAGNYSVVLKDAKGCSVSQIAAVSNATSPLQLSLTSTANSGCARPTGTITATVSGGQGTLQYQLNNGPVQTSNVFTGLANGSYSISVADQSNCTVSGTATIVSPPIISNDVSFATDVNPIITANCATVSCHNGNRRPTLNSYSTISANAFAILSAINSNMPPGGHLSTEQIGLITCWVNAGAPNN